MIQYQILQIGIIIIVCQIVKRITNEIFGVKELKRARGHDERVILEKTSRQPHLGCCQYKIIFFERTLLYLVYTAPNNDQ